ncbi:MAG: hypothetical protein HZA01_16490 [Nitrospinae bacterium]|nr:hypothetical protein [Nitrospinota bacterium]
MQPAPSIALNAKLYLRHSKSTDVLTEEGRQVNNANLSPTAAYQENGAPRMGFSREPADFAFASYMKTKSGEIRPTEGKNVLRALNQSSAPVQSGNSSPAQSEPPAGGGNAGFMAARNNSTSETSKGTAVNVTA